MRVSTSARFSRILFLTVLVMLSTSLNCGICFGKRRPFGGGDQGNEGSMKHVSASQKPEYQPHGSDRVVAPWNEDQNKTLDQWNYMPPRDYFDGAFDSNEDWYDDGSDNDYED